METSDSGSFYNKIKKIFNISKKEMVKTTAIGRAMIEESQLENKKRALLKELGELTYALYNRGEISNKEVEIFCRKINILINRIDEKVSTIDNIKSGKTS